MKLTKYAVSSLFSVIVTIFASIPSYASPVNNTIIRSAPAAASAQQAWWNSLTPRQQALERAITQQTWGVYQQTGNSILPTEQNVIIMMRTIGASPSDAPFIYERMHHHHLTVQTLNKSGNMINKYQGVVDCLNRSGGLNCWQ